MCGINGYIGPHTSPLEGMNTATSHRGPDFAGVYTNGNVHLGHRLLAIRENATASRQPFQKQNSPWVLVFNGQIYNTRQLASDFSIQFQDLDTALVYDLIEKIGWDFIRHIQGMFAIALYNTEKDELRLYRDQSGQKPLYYTHQNDAFIFSSEIKGLEAAGASFSKSHEGLAVATSLGYIPGRLTLFKNVFKLDAGEMVIFKQNSIAERTYYESNTRHFEGAPKDVLQALVREHLASKQKVALNLSGGMDSSLLLHEMKSAGHTLTTYTTAFEGAKESFNDDAEIARKLANDYGTTHTEIVITKDIYLNNLLQSYELIEEPNYNISLPTYLEVAKREGIHGDGNRVILSGDGGDEVFGGYPYYAKSHRYQQLMNVAGAPIFSAAKWLRSGKYFNYGNPTDMWLSFKTFDMDVGGYDRAYTARYVREIAHARAMPFSEPVRNQMLLDRALWMPGENFIRSDKLYMSQSLEMRSPLSYEPFREYMDRQLSTDEYIGITSNKRFLRKLYSGLLPDYVTRRDAKTGWRSPVRPWFDKEFKKVFISVFSEAPRGGSIQWDALQKSVEENETWPGKYFFLYLSLAILSKRYNVIL